MSFGVFGNQFYCVIVCVVLRTLPSLLRSSVVVPSHVSSSLWLPWWKPTVVVVGGCSQRVVKLKLIHDGNYNDGTILGL